MPRYKVTGLPAEASRGLSAFFPHLNRLAASGAQQYKDGVSGYPGTRAIAVSGIPFAPSPDLGDIAQMGLSRAGDAPPAFWPNLYWALPERNYRPGLLVQMYDPTQPWLTTHVPVPALSYRQAYLAQSAALAQGIQPGGSSSGQIRQPLSMFVRWRDRLTGNGIPSG